ncbi:MAG: hypothetical protein JWL59_5081 [Chthoniobacteraceae bacterium]|nr:hypothetical protein [Chthoniobacteraceae bacterium]
MPIDSLSPPRQPLHRRGASLFIGVIWLGLCVIGLAALSNYESHAGSRRASPALWPEESLVERTAGKPTLILFAHSHCPCTRATLGELDALLAQNSAPVRVHVVFYDPTEGSEQLPSTDLRNVAAAIPGVELHSDMEGSETVRFGADTSGYVVFYDETGKLGFSGGITASRGHAGENPGRSALADQLNKRAVLAASPPVFGCPIFGTGELRKTIVCPQ